jgi:hypothetical protein
MKTSAIALSPLCAVALGSGPLSPVVVAGILLAHWYRW